MCRARRASRRRAVSAALRHRGHDAAVRREGAGQGTLARGSGKGQRHRDDLHLRRRDGRRVVARAQPAGARGDSPRRHAAGGGLAIAGVGIDRSGAGQPLLRRCRAAVGVESADQNRRAAPRIGGSRRRAAADHARRQVLRKRGPSARDRHEPAVVHQDDRVSRRAARARTRVAVAPTVHAGAVRELDERPQRRLVRQPPALLRRAVSGVVSDRCRRQRRLRASRRRERRPSSDRSVHGRAGGVHGRSAREAGRIRRRPRRHGHLGDVVADAADRLRLGARSGALRQDVSDGSSSAGARHHPDVAVRHGVPVAPGARLAAVVERGAVGLGPGSGSQEDVEVESNVVTPLALLEEHGSDGVRYWAASGRPGTDTAFDPNQMRVGRRLAIKVLNASRFALSAAGPQGAIVAPVDRAMLRNLSALVAEATEAFEAYDYARVLQRTESFFWRFCDDYLELVKGRRYGEHGPEGAGSANAALTGALSVLLRVLAPFLPFVTEEVWSWWQSGSIHIAPWPTPNEVESLLADNSTLAREHDQRVAEWATSVLFEVRKQRSEAKQPMRVPITKVTIKAEPSALELMPLVEADLKAALRVRTFELSIGEPRDVVVEGYEAVSP